MIVRDLRMNIIKELIQKNKHLNNKNNFIIRNIYQKIMKKSIKAKIKLISTP
jgi:hypothetical protein